MKGSTGLVFGVVCACSLLAGEPTQFRVKIEAVSKPDTLRSKDGSTHAVPLTPGTWCVFQGDNPIFTDGKADRGMGLENQAEDGNPSRLAASLDSMKAMKMGVTHGVFNTPVGSESPGVITAGKAYEFVISANPGDRFTFTTMWTQSNDLFLSGPAAGIPLFDQKGQPVSGELTAQVMLWDAGTEVNEAPGIGPNQGARQGGSNVGPTENGVVRPVSDGFTYPAAAEVVRVTVTPVGASKMDGGKAGAPASGK